MSNGKPSSGSTGIATAVSSASSDKVDHAVTVPAALSVLRDADMTDAEARKAALVFLQQLEAGHGH
jgi:hypothetical protein